MSKSPGHQRWPDHKVLEELSRQRVRVMIGDDTIAESNQVIRVDEDKHPPRYYFPRSDVRMDKLQRSQTTTECPFKGTAHYFHVNAGGKTFEDAVWTYEEPYDEHLRLKDRVAFDDQKISEIRITSLPARP